MGHALPDVVAHYGFDDWPATPRTLDLGERVLDVIPAPGHHPSATAFHDRRTGLLLTGDSLYPGRIYVADWAEFAASVDRLVAWAEDHPSPTSRAATSSWRRPARTTGRVRPTSRTNRLCQMPAGALVELQAALRRIDGRPGEHALDRFHVWYHA